MHKTIDKRHHYNTKYNVLNNQYISQLAVESSSALNKREVFLEKCIKSCILAFSILCLILKQSQTEIKITSIKNSLVRLTKLIVYQIITFLMCHCLPIIYFLRNQDSQHLVNIKKTTTQWFLRWSVLILNVCVYTSSTGNLIF